MYSSQYFCPILTISGVSQQTSIKDPNIKFHRNSSSGSCIDISKHTHTDMKLTEAFCNYVNMLTIGGGGGDKEVQLTDMKLR